MPESKSLCISTRRKFDRTLWLVDFTHTTQQLAAELIPYGIGLLLAHAEDKFKFQSPPRIFKYPEKFQDWDKKYSELQKHKGFAKALISTLKNHESLDCIHEEISKTDCRLGNHIL